MKEKRSLLDTIIERRFKGYRHRYNRIDENLPLRLAEEKRAVIIGSGIAGLTAGIHLAERGFNVTIKEKNNYLGGKVGSWPVTQKDGTPTFVEHGFHAFFRQYYNLHALLRRIDPGRRR